MTDVAEADIQRAWERVQITGNPWRVLNTCGFVRAMLRREEPQLLRVEAPKPIKLVDFTLKCAHGERYVEGACDGVTVVVWREPGRIPDHD